MTAAVGEPYVPRIYYEPDPQPGEFWWNCDPLPVNFPGPKVWFHMNFLEALYAGTAPNGGGSWTMSGDDRQPPFRLTWRSPDDDRDYVWLLRTPPVMDARRQDELFGWRLGIWPD